MSAVGRGIEFFKAGGTLHPDSPSYVKRLADEDLLRQITSGQFCYVLTARQMGKSSLMIRTAGRLRQEGTHVAIVDLSGLGTQATIEQWYLGILKRLTQSLNLSIEPERWWDERGALSAVQRFTDFLREVVLVQVEGEIVLFMDEIDSTLRLNFTDDFFAAIRVMYNLRASDPEYDRLTFVLLGVAAPGDLIKDRDRTPFNIGQAIDLQEFTRQDAQPLQEGLEQIYPGQGQQILDRIFHWTNGHPYLTQKLCLEIAESSNDRWSNERIDELVQKLFLSEQAQSEDNLQFVRSSIKADPQRRSLLQLYHRVYRGKIVEENKRSPAQNRLSLIGLVHAQGGALRVRNEIYRRVFDLSWIKENTPINWTWITTVIGGLVSVLAIVLAIFFVRWQRQTKQATLMKTYTDGFRNSNSANVQAHYLAGLCKIGACEKAQEIFFAKSQEQQLAMFRRVDARGAGHRLVTVIDCLSPSIPDRIEDVAQQKALSKAMCCALYRSDPARGERFSLDKRLDCECEQTGGEQ